MVDMVPKDDRHEKVQHVLNNIAEVAFEGYPIPKYEVTNSLEELKEQYNIPGIGIVYIQDFKPYWLRYFGTRSKSVIFYNMAVNMETIFEAASSTKTIVTVAALHLVEKGLIELDVDVNQYFVDWKIPESEYTIEKK